MRTDRLDEYDALDANGRSDVPSMVRPGVAPVSATIVGATSMLATGWDTVAPAGKPGPRFRSGTRSDSSYGIDLPNMMRCSPYWYPLSEVKMMKVLSSAPAYWSASTTVATASSTDSTDSASRS